MKNVAVILVIVLLAVLGAGAYFYLFIHAPMKVEYQKMSQGMPELERAKAELKKYREQEARESGWTPAVAETLRSALKEEIASGKAEVAAAGGRVVVDIAEQALYTPGSRTFSKDTATLSKLPSLLKARGLDDKEILIGNTTPSVPALVKGRKKEPAKDGRMLAGERSLELVKYLEKNGVNAQELAAVAWPPNPADRGFRIKDRKTMIVIAVPAAAQETVATKPPVPAPAVQQPKPVAGAPSAVPARPAPPQPAAPQSRQAPVQPAQPK